MFQFPGLAFDPYVFRAKYLHVKTGNPKSQPRFRGQSLGVPVFEGGFPHSEIFGSKLIRSSPKLIAAYHVLHRLLAPRHPPNALKTLDRSHRRYPPLGRGSFPQLALRIERHRRLLKRPASHCLDDGAVSTQRSPGGLAPTCDPPTEDPRVDRTMPYSRCQTATRPSTGRSRHVSRRIAKHRFSRTALEHAPPHHSTLISQGNGGARRDRTDDLMLAKHALSQLSYGPSGRLPQEREREALNKGRSERSLADGGGPGTTRTSDLTLIRGAL